MVRHASKLDTCDAHNVFVLGHSEGCIIAPQISLNRPNVAGLILLCPFINTMESILIRQATQLQQEFESKSGLNGLFRKFLSKILGMTVASQRRLIERLKTSNAASFSVRFQKVPAKLLRELLQLDPRAIFSRVSCPMLLIGAEKDLQCEPGDIAKIAAVASVPVETHVIKDLTHVLRFEEGVPSILGSGGLLSKPIEPIILDRITDWLQKQI